MLSNPESGVAELLTFQLDTEIVAVEAVRVREILDHTPVTRVPGAPAFADGLINVRGQVIPLADLRLRLDLEARPPTVDSRIVVIEAQIGGEAVTVGIRADKVIEVTELSSADMETAPRLGMRWREDFIRFVGKRGRDLIIALDADQILSGEAGRRGAAALSTTPSDTGPANAEPGVP
jgi:purine-binding chemotaxis protein CheW